MASQARTPLPPPTGTEPLSGRFCGTGAFRPVALPALAAAIQAARGGTDRTRRPPAHSASASGLLEDLRRGGLPA